MVSKAFFKRYSPVSLLEAKDPEGLVNLTHRDMVGMICVGDHQTLLYMKYKLWALCLWNRRSFKDIPIISLCELLITICMTSFHSRGLLGKIYVGDH